MAKTTKKTAAPADSTKGINTEENAKNSPKFTLSREVGIIDPKAIVIPGVDTAWDAGDPLCDARALAAQEEKAPHFDPSLVALYAANDPHMLPPPVVLTVDGKGRLIKVDGGRRIIHARKAGAKGIEYIVSDMASPALMFMAVKRANIGRVNDSAIAVARDAERARTEFGIPLKEYASKATELTEEVLRQRIALLFLCPELQALTELPADADGYLPFSVAIQLAKLQKPAKPAEETEDHKAERFALQLATYKKLLEAGNLTTAAVRREKKGQGAEIQAKEGGDGAGEGTTEGKEGGEGTTKKPKKGEAVADAWSLKEIRHVLRVVGDKSIKEHEFMDLTPATIAVLKVIAGQAKAETVKGMARAQTAVRTGATTKPAETAATTETAKTTTEETAAAE